MHSYILVSNHQEALDKKREEIVKKYNIEPYRQTIITSSSDIKTIRKAIKELHNSSSPSYHQCLIIQTIGNMDTASQTTLLKTIEEPPLQTICIIQARFSDYILPTILSRSYIIRIRHKNEMDKTDNSTYWKPIFTALSINTLLNHASDLINTHKERDEIIQWIDSQIIFFRDLMYIRAGEKHSAKLSSSQISRIIANFLRAKRYIMHNANQKLVVDNLFLTLLN